MVDYLDELISAVHHNVVVPLKKWWKSYESKEESMPENTCRDLIKREKKDVVGGLSTSFLVWVAKNPKRALYILAGAAILLFIL